MKLVVTQAFGPYLPGDEITDAKDMDAALSSNASAVVKVATDAKPAPAPAPAAKRE